MNMCMSVCGSLVPVLVVLGFAYLVFVFANKEKKGVKTTGLVIAWAIAVLSIVLYVYGAIYAGNMKGSMMNKMEMHKMMMRK